MKTVQSVSWSSPQLEPFTNRELDEEGIERATQDYGVAAKYVK
jgi:hypothetical protein